MAIEQKQNTRIKRETSQRRAVLAAVKANFEVHHTADEIYTLVQKKLPRISLGTIYRNLEDLVADGVIRALSFPNQAIRFDGLLEHHAHFFCERCGSVANVHLENEVNDIANKLSKVHLHKITSVKCDITGVCMACQFKESMKHN